MIARRDRSETIIINFHEKYPVARCSIRRIIFVVMGPLSFERDCCLMGANGRRVNQMIRGNSPPPFGHASLTTNPPVRPLLVGY